MARIECIFCGEQATHRCDKCGDEYCSNKFCNRSMANDKHCKECAAFVAEDDEDECGVVEG